MRKSTQTTSLLCRPTSLVVVGLLLAFPSSEANAAATASSPTPQQQDENCGHRPGDEPPALAVDPATVVDPTTLHSKIMAGYQGWFDTPCSDYSNAKWKHWSHRGGPPPDPTAYQFEMWPDLTEYDDDELCPTGFKYADGTTAGLFSSYNAKTVDRHVRWMHQYNVDGVFLQRFLNQLDGERCFEDKVLDNIRTSAERYGRVFANMYDIGKNTDDVVQRIKDDWMYLVDVQEITSSRSYLYHRGRPLLSLWGFGTANRPGEPREVMELVDWFHNHPVERYRATVKGGVPNGWQDLGASSKKDAGWAEAYRSFDVLSPWSVGRYEGLDGADDFARKVTIPNAAECEALGIDYMPVVWPGFSWSYRNLRYPDLDEPFNKYPRQAGNFFWRQMHNSLEAFSESAQGKQIYVAMFDEVDEATSVMKVAESQAQVPTEGNFLTMDADGEAVPSDWYLKLIGDATTRLRSDGKVPIDMPKLSQEPTEALPALSSEYTTTRSTQAPTSRPTSRPTTDDEDGENIFVMANLVDAESSEAGSARPRLTLLAAVLGLIVMF